MRPRLLRRLRMVITPDMPLATSSIPAAWFAQPARLNDFLVDLIKAEVAALRPGVPPVIASPGDSLNFDASGLALDSLEIMALSSALARTLHLHESHIEDNLFNKVTLQEWQAIALQSLNVFSQRISFKTSGSVGLKKYQTHALPLLEQEAAYLGQLLKGRQRILRAVPAQHIYGFIFTVLLPRYFGNDMEVIDIRGLSPNALHAVMQPGDLIVAYPEFWQYLHAAQIPFPADIVGVNSSGPCPADVGLSLLQQQHLSTFFEVYGSSETAGIGWRTHPLQAFTLFPFWQTSTSVQEIERQSADATKLAYALQDHLLWSSSTEFVVKGRIDEVVQVGGTNVSLHGVREKLLQHPLIKDAAVRLMPLETGARLKVYVVLDTHAADRLASEANAQPVIEHIQHYINNSLSVAERPKSLTIGPSIPVNTMGKHCDWPV